MRRADPPSRPLTGGRVARWQDPAAWLRVYHRSAHTPDGWAPRTFGPLGRFDHHPPTVPAAEHGGDGPAVLYLGDALATALAEAFQFVMAGDPWPVCAQMRVSATTADDTLLQDLSPVGAVALDAAEDLGHARDYARSSTQAWARAIVADRPSGDVVGAVYRSARRADGHNVVLWDHVPTPLLRAGQGLDLGLRHPNMWPRVLVAASAGAVPISSATCGRCP